MLHRERQGDRPARPACAAGCSCRDPAAGAGTGGAWLEQSPGPSGRYPGPRTRSCPGRAPRSSSAAGTTWTCRSRIRRRARNFRPQTRRSDAAHGLDLLLCRRSVLRSGTLVGLGHAADATGSARRAWRRHRRAASSLQMRGDAVDKLARIGVLRARRINSSAVPRSTIRPPLSTSDLVGDLAHDRQRGGDEDDAGVEVLAQLAQQPDDLRRDGHVERLGDIVGR